MKDRVALLFLGVGVFIGGFLLVSASNTAFVNKVTLHGPGPNSAVGLNLLNLPYRAHERLRTSADLMNDLGGKVNVEEIRRFLPATDTFVTFTGGKTQEAFPIVPGECLTVVMKNDVDYSIKGAHNPGLSLQLKAAPEAFSGTNFVSLPYHVAADDAKELRDDIGAGNVQSIQRYVKVTNTWETFTGAKGQIPFSIDPDECYAIKMGTTVDYIPTHY